MLLASYSGFNFGIKKSIPLILGVTFGYTILITLAAGGLNIIFNLILTKNYYKNYWFNFFNLFSL